jgi:hypothetical protein
MKTERNAIPEPWEQFCDSVQVFITIDMTYTTKITLQNLNHS